MRPHSGIRIDQIPADGVGGFLFTIAIAAIGLIAFPEIRFLATIGLVGGVMFAGFLTFWHNQTRW